jgi:hypothetical protein
MGPRKAALARSSNKCKLQTRPLVREGAQHQQIRDCLKIIQKRKEEFVTGPRWMSETKTGWPTDGRLYYNFHFRYRCPNNNGWLTITEFARHTYIHYHLEYSLHHPSHQEMLQIKYTQSHEMRMMCETSLIPSLCVMLTSASFFKEDNLFYHS